MIEVKVKKLNEVAKLPTKATDGSACFDLYSTYEGSAPGQGLHSGEPIGTGLSFEIPIGYAMMIYSRSGMGFKDSVRLSNCVGVIDSDYRGEVKVSLRCDSYNNRKYKPGDRIAQCMLIEIPKVSFIEDDHLYETDRGNGGFGSTGV